MSVHVSHAALPPIKHARYSLLIPYLDADGDPTDPTTPDTEVSIDGAAFADCTEEVTTVTGSNGMGLMTLTGAETNGSAIGLAAKVASGPKNTLGTIYPIDPPILFSCTATAGAAGTITLPSTIPAWAQSVDAMLGAYIRTTGGTGGGGTGGANNQARRIMTNTAARVCSTNVNWETNPDGTTTVDVLMSPEWVARIALISLTQNFTARQGMGIAAMGTTSNDANTDATKFRLGAATHGDIADVKAGDIIVFPSAFLSTRAIAAGYNTGTGDGTPDGSNFSATVVNTPYIIFAQATKVALAAADAGSGFVTAVQSGLATAAAVAAIATTLLNPPGVKKNTALPYFAFPMVDVNGNLQPGATVTAQRKLDNAAFAACANAVSAADTDGLYKISLAAADLNGDLVTLKFTAPGCRTRYITIQTEP